MEALKKGVTSCVVEAKELYESMLVCKEFDAKPLIAVFDRLQDREANVPRLLERSSGPTPIFVFNICYVADGALAQVVGRRVPVLQLSGGFFPNHERALFSMTEISIVDARPRLGTAAPARTDDKKTPRAPAPPPSQIEVHRINRQPPFGYSYVESPKGLPVQRARDGI